MTEFRQAICGGSPYWYSRLCLLGSNNTQSKCVCHSTSCGDTNLKPLCLLGFVLGVLTTTTTSRWSQTIFAGFRISLLSIAPGHIFLWGGCRPPTPPAFQWGGSAPPHPSEKLAFGLHGPQSPHGMEPRTQMALDQDWTWSYLGPRWIFGKLKNKQGHDRAQDGSI